MIKLGFHPSPWLHAEPPGTLAEAMRDIAATGWDGLEMCNSQAPFYPARPEDIAVLLRRHNLSLATYYLGQSLTDGFDMGAALAAAERHVEINRACGSGIILLDGGGRAPAARAETHIRRIADYANRVGELARKCGLACAWHQHYGTIFDKWPAFEQLMALTDPALVGFCPDTAQLAMSGFDVQETICRYLDRVIYIHFKDVEFLDAEGQPEPELRPGGARHTYGKWGKSDCRVREPGRGKIGFAAVWRLLQSRRYDGWIVCDLDYTLTTPVESSRYTLDYLRRLTGCRPVRGQAGDCQPPERS